MSLEPKEHGTSAGKKIQEGDVGLKSAQLPEPVFFVVLSLNYAHFQAGIS